MDEEKSQEELDAERKRILQINDLLTSINVRLIQVSPFFGMMAAYFRFVDKTDEIKTFGTDGACYYYNREFIASLTKTEVIYTLAHAAGHVILAPMMPERDVNSHRRVRAENYMIGAMLAQAGFKHGSLNPELDLSLINADMSFSEAVEALRKRDEAANIDQDHPSDFDDHRYVLKMEEADIADYVSRVMSASMAGKDSTPGIVRGFIEQMGVAKIDYKDYLRSMFSAAVSSGRSYSRFNRRSGKGIIRPGKNVGETLIAGIFIDNSGSMNDVMLRDLLTEVSGLMNMFDDFHLWVACYDTSVHNPVLFTKANIHDILTYELKGGGGTDFSCIYQWIEDQKIDIYQVVNFTDGCDFGDFGASFHVNGKYETLFVLHSHPGKFEPGFGQVVEYSGSVSE